MQITVNDEALSKLLAETVKNTLVDMLKPDWTGKTRRYPVITDAVTAYIAALDLSPYIETALAEHATAAVNDAVNQAVRARTGKIMGAMVTNGALDAKIAAIVQDIMGA